MCSAGDSSSVSVRSLCSAPCALRYACDIGFLRIRETGLADKSLDLLQKKFPALCQNEQKKEAQKRHLKHWELLRLRSTFLFSKASLLYNMNGKTCGIARSLFLS